MSKTLLVSYTPRYESNTEKLMQTYVQINSTKSDIAHLDLVKHPAPLLLESNLNALVKRHYLGEELNDAEKNAVQDVDDIIQRFLEAERIVIVFPMYNFSLPATVKAWIDTIILNGKTFNVTNDGGYEGMCQDKEALILMTAGGDYRQEPAKSMNYATPLIQTCLSFMGIKSHTITAHGLNQYLDKIESIIAGAQHEIEVFCNENESW